VPVLLEMKGIPFVGGDGLTLAMSLDKIVAKKLFISDGIPTPRFFEVNDIEEIEKLKTIDFPLIVKTRHEGSSKGITAGSRVEDMKSLKRQVELINADYGQSALVEEFIKGTEFTVAVLGNDEPKAMPVVQVSINGNVELGNEIYTHERIESDVLQYICPARIPGELTRRIQDLAVRVYKCVECRDFGRVDFRVDEGGDPFVLEINPLPSLDVRDVFNIFPNVIDSSYNEVVNQVVNFALKRYGLPNNGSAPTSKILTKSLEEA
jgi:D-alanine-D-alanine ligase